MIKGSRVRIPTAALVFDHFLHRFINYPEESHENGTGVKYDGCEEEGRKMVIGYQQGTVPFFIFSGQTT